MGKILTSVEIINIAASSGFSKKVDVLVDTGACYLTLPLVWKEEFGKFASEKIVELQTATQEIVEGTICGPVKIKVAGFRAVYNEVLFVEMQSDEGQYESLLGYIILEQCGVVVDMLGHRLVPVRYMDLKKQSSFENTTQKELENGKHDTKILDQWSENVSLDIVQQIKNYGQEVENFK